MFADELKKAAYHMRVVILALSVFGVLACSGTAEALDCPIPPYVWSTPAGSDEIPAEQRRRDLEDRLNLHRLEQAPILFRGRVVSARYLTDTRKTSIPISLLVFDRVEVLKGRLFTTSKDRKAFVISEGWCDTSCSARTATEEWPPGKTVGVAAYPNTFADPLKAVETTTKRVVYRGRIDAMFGPCGGGYLSDRALELFNNDDELSRTKR